MPVRIEPHAEPIPGYRLIERLGSGGFGEVWKAEAPGGLFKAIKFVQRGSGGDESSVVGVTDMDRSRADQEMKSLSRVKTVHHPYVISLDRFEIVEDYLVIVMELADRTLADRFKQCRSQGLPGVPREELLSYLEEAAEALDLMNSLYQLQHLDIKPQNLFLVHNHVKVADFGLVKDITDQKFMTITGGVTPVYAAPETFDGKFSRQSDQYSLAIVYQETLTGHRPFTGTTIKQLILQHLQNAHDLSPAPVHDRPIIARALSKNPEDRFPTCIEFVQALKRTTVKPRPGDEPAAVMRPLPGEKSFPSAPKTVGARGLAGPVKPSDPNFNAEKELGDGGATPAPTPAPVVPKKAPAHAKKPAQKAAPRVELTPATAPRGDAKPARPDPHGIVQPALIIGIGQLGVETLTQMRQRIATEFASAFALPHVRLVAIDTDPEIMQKATFGNDRAILRTQETFLARLQRPSHYLKTRDGKLPTDNWLNPKLLYRIPREQAGAGVRALGRLAFVDNYRAIAKRIEAELLALCSQDTPHESSFECDLGLRTSKPRVYLVTSLAGNTGSGMIIDLAYLVRRLLNEQGHSAAEIVGLFFLPNVQRDPASAAPLANAHAALIELQHYCRRDVVYNAHYDTAASLTKVEKVAVDGPALQRCIFLPLAETRGKVKGINNGPSLALAGDFLYRDLATSLGQTFDEERQAILDKGDHHDSVDPTLLQSIGMCRILWPRHALLQQSARRLCSQLVTHWMKKDAGPLAATIRQWTHECWETLGMRPENLIERFQTMAEHALQKKPEHMLAEILGPAQELLCPKDTAKAKTITNVSPIVQALDCLERILGIPDEVRGTKQMQSEASIFERTFEEISHVISDECEQKLAELAVTLLENPNFRLAGAEEALRQFSVTVEQSLRSQESLAKELVEKAGQLHVRIQQWLDKPMQSGGPTTSSTQWSFGLTRRNTPGPGAPNPADLFELLRTYTKTRFHSIVLSHLNRLYLGLRGHLSDQIREVGFCRQRLGELHNLVRPDANAQETIGKDDRALFPPGCQGLTDAVDQLVESITPEDLLAFDERIQTWVKTHCQALLQICMGSSTTVRNVAPAMLQEAELFLGERVEGASVADMYLSRKRGEHGDDSKAAIVDDLERCLDDATPEFGRIKGGNEVTIITLPDNEQGVEIKNLLRSRLKEAKILLTHRQDEMLFYHEIVSMKWKDLEQLGAMVQEIYEQRCTADPSALHTREDVFDWNVIVESKR